MASLKWRDWDWEGEYWKLFGVFGDLWRRRENLSLANDRLSLANDRLTRLNNRLTEDNGNLLRDNNRLRNDNLRLRGENEMAADNTEKMIIEKIQAALNHVEAEDAKG